MKNLKRSHLVKVVLVVFVMSFVVFLTACNNSVNLKSSNTSNSSENVSLFETFDQREYMAFIGSMDKEKYLIISTDIVENAYKDKTYYGITYKKMYFQTPKISNNYNITNLSDRVYVYTGKDVGEYLSFIEEFDNIKYKLLDISINFEGNEKVFNVTYKINY